MKFSVDDFFVVRVPRQPVSLLARLPVELEAMLDVLASWVAQPYVREALYLASPSLLERLPGWQKDPQSKQGKKITAALLKYFIRMTSRPTPFGLFAGVALGQVTKGEATRGGVTDSDELHALDPQHDQRKTRLDMFYLSTLRDALETALPGEAQVAWQANPTLHRVHDALHYIEPYESGNARQYRLSSVEVDEYLLVMQELAAEPLTRDELAQRFCARYAEAEVDEVRAYLDQSCQEGVLLCALPLPLTGQGPDQAFANQLDAAKAQQPARRVRAALDALAAMDRAPSETDIGRYKQIKTGLETLPFKLTEGKLFQVDLYRGFSRCTLAAQTAQRLAGQLTLLAQLSRPCPNPLQDFISRFNKRYESQMVPLLQLLNEETGLSMASRTGYDSELLAGLHLNKGGNDAVNAGGAADSSPLERLVTEAVLAPENANQSQVRLSSKQLKREVAQLRKEQDLALPRSLAAIISLYRDAQDQPMVHFKGCYGPSAANLLGRFCHLNEGLRDKVKAHLRQEESHSPEVIFAEVVHMPDGRPGNVIARPHLRDYEIVFLGDSGLPHERQIPVSDLYVLIEGQQVKLWSQRLQRRIVPRLSSAHNYSSRSLGIYRFLCMLQQQDVQLPGFSLPEALAQASCVPRIMLDNLILHEQSWRVPRERLEALIKGGHRQPDAWQQLQTEYRLPRYVTFSRSDNVLTLDLHNPAMVDILLGETNGQSKVPLSEALSMTCRPAVQGESDADYYTNELIVPFINDSAKVERLSIQHPQQRLRHSIERDFAPGSQWMSLKLYGAHSSVENLLVRHLPEVLRQHEDCIDKWFFIRYGDPDWHLRLRFYGDPERLYGTLLPALQQRLAPELAHGLLHRLELFTYSRETERYGGEQGIDSAETLFMHESTMVLSGMEGVRRFGDSFRWRLAVAGCDALMSAFGYDSAQKFRLIDVQRQAFGREFNESKTLRSQLGEKYRRFAERIAADLSALGEPSVIGVVADDDANNSHNALMACVYRYRTAIAPQAARYQTLANQGALVCSLDELLSSLLHMLNNRLFKAYGREQELVIYDLLRRHYLGHKQAHRHAHQSVEHQAEQKPEWVQA